MQLREALNGVVLIAERSPGRRLYAAIASVGSYGKPASRGVAVLTGQCWRVVDRDGTLDAVGVSLAALQIACGLQGSAVTLKESKTPFHRESVLHAGVFPALRALAEPIRSLDADLRPLTNLPGYSGGY